MSKKYIKYNKKRNISPEKFIVPGSMDALLLPDRFGMDNSGFFMKAKEDDFIAELSQSEMDELFDLIEEFENKNEKDN